MHTVVKNALESIVRNKDKVQTPPDTRLSIELPNEFFSKLLASQIVRLLHDGGALKGKLTPISIARLSMSGAVPFSDDAALYSGKCDKPDVIELGLIFRNMPMEKVARKVQAILDKEHQKELDPSPYAEYEAGFKLLFETMKLHTQAVQAIGDEIVVHIKGRDFKEPLMKSLCDSLFSHRFLKDDAYISPTDEELHNGDRLFRFTIPSKNVEELKAKLFDVVSAAKLNQFVWSEQAKSQYRGGDGRLLQ